MNYKYILWFLVSYFHISYSFTLDLIIFSFDRPMQLYALLESIQARLKGISHISVLYRASDAEFEKAYNTTQNIFSDVTFYRHYGKHDFQSIATEIIHQSCATHLFFGVDDLIVTDKCNLRHCIYTLEKTGSYCFALRLGKNITECYTCNLLTPVPTFVQVTPTIYSFQYGKSKGDWDYPNSVDMNIYRKKTVLDFVDGGYEWQHPNFMEGKWAQNAPTNVRGLCCETSKIVNIPMNVVNVDWESRNMKSYTKYELVNMFNQGYKIDIKCVYKYLPRAPHEEINLTFIPR